MGLKDHYNFIDRDGATPLDHDQIIGIRLKHLTTMGELDEVEDLNIQRGLEWLERQKKDNYLSSEFLCLLHKKLFGDVWKWAGKYRTSEVNISKHRSFDVGPQLLNLFEDAKLWIEGGKMTWDEIAAELHHRLVSIHPFPNGNGRTTRIFTEYVLKRNDCPLPSWMGSLADQPQLRRKTYIKALQSADKGDYTALIKFLSEKKTS